jgi:tetratricopeptide (TPR) repeat protein
MRKLFVLVWLLIPTGLVAYHYGPGQAELRRDKAAALLKQIRAAESNGEWRHAVSLYSRAIAELPETDVATHFQLRLAMAKARNLTGELPEARADLEALLSEVLAADVDQSIRDDVRATLAAAHYHVAWLMRVEGAGTEEWAVETDAARQHFRLLAEQSVAGSAERRGYEENLEAVIRLARMDLDELQARPLPKECQNCSDCSGKCRAQKESKRTAKKKPSNDIREEMHKTNGASLGQRPDGSGS